MIKVAINASPLVSGHKTRGIGFYTKSLLEYLRKIKDLKIEEFSQISEVKDADIVHYPFFDLFYPTLPFRKKFPTVVTIHDVTPLVFPQHYPPGIRGALNLLRQKLALRNVAAVITDSDFSKKDITSYLPVNPKNIFPVSLAPLAHFKQIKEKEPLEKVRKKYQLPPNFALYTGNVNWNKNLLNLSEACVKEGIDLVLVGRSFEQKENLDHPELQSYKEFLKKFAPLKTIHILGFVPNEDLAAITNLARVQLLPSYYEGFGLPILEAQACNIPVITSDVSSMPEVAGEGAVLVDPCSVGEITEAIYKISNNAQFREEIIKKGRENAQKFSWEKTAEETLQVYKTVLK